MLTIGINLAITGTITVPSGGGGGGGGAPTGAIGFADFANGVYWNGSTTTADAMIASDNDNYFAFSSAAIVPGSGLPGQQAGAGNGFYNAGGKFIGALATTMASGCIVVAEFVVANGDDPTNNLQFTVFDSPDFATTYLGSAGEGSCTVNNNFTEQASTGTTAAVGRNRLAFKFDPSNSLAVSLNGSPSATTGAQVVNPVNTVSFGMNQNDAVLYYVKSVTVYPLGYSTLPLLSAL